MPSPTNEHRRTVSPVALAHARARVEAVGVDGAATELGLSRGALVNVLAGIGVRHGTIAALELAFLQRQHRGSPTHINRVPEQFALVTATGQGSDDNPNRNSGEKSTMSVDPNTIEVNAVADRTAKYVVAPGKTVAVIGNRDFIESEELTASDLHGHTLDPQGALQHLIDRGLVLEKKELSVA